MKPDFTNISVAFSHLTDKELKRAVFLFSFITKPFWVNIGKFFLVIAKTLRIPYGWAVRKNVFRHFCGGETIEKCIPAMQKLSKANCFSILDFSAEGLEGEKNFDSVCAEIQRTIDFAGSNAGISFGVYKFTGMCEFSLLEKVSENAVLSQEDQLKWQKAKQRAESIFSLAASKNIPVFVDAEETWIQPAIDSMLEPMMEYYNKQSAIVFTTIQMYRSDSFGMVNTLIEKARAGNYIAGVKLVRGAYMEKERNRALRLGYPSPIHVDKASTDNAFNEAVRLCIQNIEHIHLCIASHNEHSCQMSADFMLHSGINYDDKRIWFAQLYGMSDHITFNLAASGFRVAKYLPYGPVEKVMPYLVRRAEENSSVAGQSNREIENLKRELKRRTEVKKQKV